MPRLNTRCQHPQTGTTFRFRCNNTQAPTPATISCKDYHRHLHPFPILIPLINNNKARGPVLPPRQACYRGRLTVVVHVAGSAIIYVQRVQGVHFDLRGITTHFPICRPRKCVMSGTILYVDSLPVTAHVHAFSWGKDATCGQMTVHKIVTLTTAILIPPFDVEFGKLPLNLHSTSTPPMIGIDFETFLCLVFYTLSGPSPCEDQNL